LFSLLFQISAFNATYFHPFLLHSCPTRRSSDLEVEHDRVGAVSPVDARQPRMQLEGRVLRGPAQVVGAAGQQVADLAAGRLGPRSEEHTSELQSREKIVCRLLLEKKTIGIVKTI